MPTMPTKEALLEDGWVSTDNPVSPLEKEISPEDAGEDDKIFLVVNTWYGQNLGVRMPDGSTLLFHANTMEELTKFETSILGWMPSY